MKDLQDDLRSIGLVNGQTIIIHFSMRNIGWVCGGAPAVIMALREVVGPSGTLVAPTFTGDLTDPSGWKAPPIPEDWWPRIRSGIAPFDPYLTPSRSMGAIPECLRTAKDAARSMHPQVSFTALGKESKFITAEHSLEYRFGEKSPLARLYDIGANVLMVGVGYKKNTSFHLAEYRSSYPAKREVERLVPLGYDDGIHWVNAKDVALVEDDFEEMGHFCFDCSTFKQKGYVGQASAILLSMKELVDYSCNWMNNFRNNIQPKIVR